MPTAAPVEFGSLTCPACGAALGPYGLDAAQEGVCPGCRAPLRGQVFRAWWTPAEAPVIRDRAMEGEAVCFFHPVNRAVLACDSCGRFLCTICDLPVGARHLCPVCLSKGLGKEKLPEIVPRRFLWARAALVLGLLLAGIHLATSPAVSTDQPIALVDRLAARNGEIRLLNHYDVGGLVTGRASPPALVAIDGRTDIWSAEYVRRYVSALTTGRGWRELVDDLRPDAALMPRASGW